MCPNPFFFITSAILWGFCCFFWFMCILHCLCKWLVGVSDQEKSWPLPLKLISPFWSNPLNLCSLPSLSADYSIYQCYPFLKFSMFFGVIHAYLSWDTLFMGIYPKSIGHGVICVFNESDTTLAPLPYALNSSFSTNGDVGTKRC